jgi:hypothetical protein
MKQYTKRELDNKIQAFITAKMDLFPELAGVKNARTESTTSDRKKSSAGRGMFSVQLKPSFK